MKKIYHIVIFILICLNKIHGCFSQVQDEARPHARALTQTRAQNQTQARVQSQTQNQTQAEIIQTTKKPDIEEEKRLELEIGLERIKKLMQKLNETKQANKFYPPGINAVIFHFFHEFYAC